MVTPRLIGVIILFAAAPALAAPPEQILPVLARADNAAMADIVRQTYEAAGISWDDRLTWQFESYDYTFNYFDVSEQIIVLGSLPTPAQVPDYWDNWSRTLTGGTWDPDGFFADVDEAATLAGFNQFILGLHEAGHAVTYRYDYDHLRRHGYEINCREFYADRLAAAAIDDLAEAAPEFARLRARYIDLIADMDAGIAEQDRYVVESLAALEADCALITVAQPTPETLQPYASAYFQRHLLLMTAELPSLAEMAVAHLFPPMAEFMAQMPYLPPPADYALVSLGTVPDFQPINDYARGENNFAPGFAADGTLYLARIAYDTAAATMTMLYGLPGALEPVLDARPYPNTAEDVRLVNIAPDGPDRFYGLLAEDLGGDGTGFTLFVASRDGSEWSVELAETLKDMQLARLFLSPGGRLVFLASTSPAEWDFNDGWMSIEIDPLTQEGTPGRAYAGIYGMPVAVDDSGRLITYAYDLLYEFDDDANFYVIAGNGLPGAKDGTDPARTELIDPTAARLMADGTLLFLDAAPDGVSGRLRRLTFASGAE